MKSQRRFLLLIERQGGVCFYCQRPFTTGGKRRPTREHLVPRAHGGSNRPTNIVAACFGCNHDRGTRPLLEFIDEIRQRT